MQKNYVDFKKEKKRSMEERTQKLEKVERELNLLEQRSLQLIAKIKNNLDKPYEIAQAEKELAEIGLLLGSFESGIASLTLTGFPVSDQHEMEGEDDTFFETNPEELDRLTKKKADTYKSVSLTLDRLTKRNGSHDTDE